MTDVFNGARSRAGRYFIGRVALGFHAFQLACDPVRKPDLKRVDRLAALVRVKAAGETPEVKCMMQRPRFDEPQRGLDAPIGVDARRESTRKRTAAKDRHKIPQAR